jgi:hypothetical protein
MMRERTLLRRMFLLFLVAAFAGVLPVHGGEVLYDQTDHAGATVPDQDFEAVYDQYDCAGADDFVVTAPSWTILGVNTKGTHSGTPAVIHVDIAFYPDAGGRPAEQALCAFPETTSFVNDGGDLTITLPSSCALSPGVYWVAQSVRQNLEPSGQHLWGNRTEQSGHASVWRNPENGFGSGCTDWGTQADCGFAGGPDLLFQIVGELGGGDPVPALGPLGRTVLVFAIGAAAAWILRRRVGL